MPGSASCLAPISGDAATVGLLVAELPDGRSQADCSFHHLRERIQRRVETLGKEQDYFCEVRQAVTESGPVVQDHAAAALKALGFELDEAPTGAAERRAWVRGPLACTVKRCIAPPTIARISQMPVTVNERYLAAA